jgi:beta-galactosidase
MAVLPAPVTVTTGAAPDGRRVHVVHNWNRDPAQVTAPRSLTDVLSGACVDADSAVPLGPWDVRVFVSNQEQ